MSARTHGREGELPPPPEPLVTPVADIHAHLDLMGGDVTESLAMAAAVGVPRAVTIGIDVETSRWAASVAGEHASLVAAVGLHPNEAGRGLASVEALAAIDELAALPQVRAIGETGIDHYRTEGEVGWALQEESLRAHVEIARRHGKALVIHDREAHADVLRVLDDCALPERVVIHAFSGDVAFAAECAARGWVCSFAGNVTFKNAQALRDAAAALPLELVQVETDAPFLTPHPWRGRPGGPYLVPLTLRCIAEARGEDVDVVAAAVDATATRVFGAWG